MLGGASAVIHYTPTVITSSSLTVGNGGALVLMTPSSGLISAASNGEDGGETDHHHHQQADGQEDEASTANNADHSPIHLPSTAFLNTHISKSVVFDRTLTVHIRIILLVLSYFALVLLYNVMCNPSPL